MNLKILLLSAALAPGLALSAFTVDDLVVDNGIYAIENLYWSKADQYISLYTAECQYEHAPLGLSKSLHFEYVKDVNGNVLPKFVKLVGFRGFTGTMSYTDRDFIFTIADENNNATEDGTRLILPNDDDWSSNYAGMAYLNFESCVSTDGRYMLGALYEIDPKWYLENLGQIPYLYQYGSTSNYGTFRVTVSNWVGEMSRNSEGNVVVEFANPAIFYATGYSGTYGYNAGRNIQSNIRNNVTHPKIIGHLTIETFRPTGFLKVTEYPTTTSGYSTTGTTTVVPYKMEMNPDGTFSVVNLTGYGYARCADPIDRVIPGTLGGYADGGRMVLTGGQLMDVYHHPTTLNSVGARGYDATLKVARLTNFPAKNFDYEDVVGEMSSDATIAHTSETNFWVFPGDCRTVIKGASLKIGPFAGVFHDTTSGEIYRSTSAFSIESEGGTAETDVTLDCKITSCNCSFDEAEMIKYVDCTFEVNKNDMYVESYDIYMIPAGKVSGNPTNNEDFQDENGHKHAIYVGSVTADSNSQTIYPKAYNVSTSVLLDKTIADAANEYYFFIAANYRSDISVASLKSVSRAASSLHPTYHSLLSPGTVTAIDGISAPEAGDAEYYDLHGRRVATPGQGIYLRRQGSSVSKIRF